MELNIRGLTEEDWPIIKDWWSYHFDSSPEKESFPDNGLSGVIAEKKGIPVSACFIYTTNSDIAFLEWILSNPKYNEKDRSNIIDSMLIAAENIIRSQGFKYIFGFTTKQRLAERLERLGHTITNTSSFELIKSLN